MTSLQYRFREWVDDPLQLILLNVLLLAIYLAFSNRKQLSFILKSLLRNKLRTILTGIATFVLVLVVTMIWTVLSFLDSITAEKSKDLKAMVTEKWQARSLLPWSYVPDLAEGAARRPTDVRPQDSMAWSFFIGSLDAKVTRENFIFFFTMNPEKCYMLDDVDQFTPDEMAELNRCVKLMKTDKTRIIVGKGRLRVLNKKVGERIKIISQNYKDIDLECEICGTLPEGRYAQVSIMNIKYLLDAIDLYALNHKGVKHPQADKVLNLMFLKTEDMASFQRLAEQVTTSRLFTNPAVKCETSSSGYASFLDAYRDLLWAMRWLLVPAILATMSLVIANAISISVRERRTEMAVLKVLGYTPGQILMLVLGEALLVGIGSGLASSGLAYIIINKVFGGVPFPIGFFPAFKIPLDALWWGPMVGGLTAFAGSIFPAWSARTVKVSEVFSKVG